MVFVSSPCFSGNPIFGGFSYACTSSDNQRRGGYVASYRPTPEEGEVNIGTIKSISAMPIYKDKSHEELRSQDYEFHKGSTLSSIHNHQGIAFEPSNSSISATTTKHVPSSSCCAFGWPSSGEVCTAPLSSPGNTVTGRVFGAPNTSGFGFNSTPSAFCSNSANSSTSSIFGAPALPCWNRTNQVLATPGSLFNSNSASGTSSIFGTHGSPGESKVSPLAPGSGINGFNSGTFAFPSSSVVEGSNTCAFQIPTPPFPSTASAGTNFFGPRSTCCCGKNTSGFLFNSTSASGTGRISGIQGSSGSHSQGETTLESTAGGRSQGSRVAHYSATRIVDGAKHSVEIFQSISAMAVYKDKSHEELRSEDYELSHKGGQSLSPAGLKTSDSPQSFFCSPPLFNQASVASPFDPFKSNPFAPKSPFDPFKSNPFAPKSKDLMTSNTTSPTFFPSPNSFPTANLDPSQSPFNHVPSPFDSFKANPLAPKQSQDLFTPNNTTSIFSPSPSPFFTTNTNPSQSFFNPVHSPFDSFKPNQLAPKSQDSSTPSNTTSTFWQSPNPFSTTNVNLSQPHVPSPFQPVKPNHLAPKSQDLFTPNNTTSALHFISSNPKFKLNAFSSIPSNEPTNSSQSPVISTAYTAPSLSTFSSPVTQSTSVPSSSTWPSILNASQPCHAVGNTNYHCTTNPSQPSQEASNGLTGPEVGYQNISGQQHVSTVGMQSSCAVAPFSIQSEIARPSPSVVQHGISSLPGSNGLSSRRNNLSSNRKTSLMRIRHMSSSHKPLPVQGFRYASSEPKVPFFCDEVDRPGPVSPVLPRENPRSWIRNSLPPHSSSDGKGCEDKDVPNPSFQLNLAGDDTSFQEEDLSDISDILALMPKLPNGDEYYTEPSLSDLAEKEMDEPGSCSRVSDFVIGRLGFGSIRFLGETDVRGLDLGSVVRFNNREVIVYADDRKKPLVGQGLNKAAEVTLLNVKCISKKTGKQYVNGPQVQSYKEMLMKKASEQGVEFVSYDPVRGEWKFRVNHF